MRWDAWRQRLWRTSPRWRRIFTMGAGAMLMLVGGSGTVFVTAPAGLKVLVLAVGAYIAVRMVRGLRRA